MAKQHVDPMKKFKPLRVDNDKGDMDIETMLRKLSKLVDKDGILKTVKKRARYEKPSDAKRRKRRAAQKMREKQDRESDF
jgi:ribosomal protein S21